MGGCGEGQPGEYESDSGDCLMDATAITALVALTGAAIGGLTTVLASWLMQKTQPRAQWFAQDKLHRQEVYKEFIEEAFEMLHQRPPARQGGHSRPGRPLCKNRPDARPVLAEGRRIRGTDRVGNSRYVSEARQELPGAARDGKQLVD
jgi:hypothetical protein